MRTAFRLGRVAGVTVDVNWTVLVIVWLLMWSLASYVLPDWVPGHATAAYWMVGLLAALGLVASILGHELSHAVVAQRNGVPVDGITLWMFGGLAKLGRRASDAGAELRIALAGPAVSVAIGAVCLALAGLSFGVGGPGLFTGAVAWLGMVNLVLAVFNLLPGAPLDGGRVLAAILWRRSGDARWARERAARAGRVLGQVLIGLGVLEFAIGAGVGGLWLAVIGWFLTTSAHAEEVQSETESLFEGVRVADVMTANPRTARADLTVEEFVLRHALTSRVSSFPVVDIDGHLEGLVTLRRLRELPRERWKATTLSRAAVPLDELSVATADELLVDVLRRSGAADGRVLVVDDCQRLVGIVTPTDVTTALDRRTLTRTLDRRRTRLHVDEETAADRLRVREDAEIRARDRLRQRPGASDASAVGENEDHSEPTTGRRGGLGAHRYAARCVEGEDHLFEEIEEQGLRRRRRQVDPSTLHNLHLSGVDISVDERGHGLLTARREIRRPRLEDHVRSVRHCPMSPPAPNHAQMIAQPAPPRWQHGDRRRVVTQPDEVRASAFVPGACSNVMFLGGRPGLAAPRLGEVTATTLLMVGGDAGVVSRPTLGCT